MSVGASHTASAAPVKLVVRHLPPSQPPSQEEWLNALATHLGPAYHVVDSTSVSGSSPPVSNIPQVQLLSWVQGKVGGGGPTLKHSRAYLLLSNVPYVPPSNTSSGGANDLGLHLPTPFPGQLPFQDPSTGKTFMAQIEMAPFQKYIVPALPPPTDASKRPKLSSRNDKEGTLDQDQDYLQFLKALEDPTLPLSIDDVVPTPSAPRSSHLIRELLMSSTGKGAASSTFNSKSGLSTPAGSTSGKSFSGKKKTDSPAPSANGSVKGKKNKVDKAALRKSVLLAAGKAASGTRTLDSSAFPPLGDHGNGGGKSMTAENSSVVNQSTKSLQSVHAVSSEALHKKSPPASSKPPPVANEKKGPKWKKEKKSKANPSTSSISPDNVPAIKLLQRPQTAPPMKDGGSVSSIPSLRSTPAASKMRQSQEPVRASTPSAANETPSIPSTKEEGSKQSLGLSRNEKRKAYRAAKKRAANGPEAG